MRKLSLVTGNEAREKTIKLHTYIWSKDGYSHLFTLGSSSSSSSSGVAQRSNPLPRIHGILVHNS